MSGGGIPTFDWAKPKPIADNSQVPTFDWATKTAQQPSGESGGGQGFIDYTKNLAKNWFNVSGVQNMMDAEKMGAPIQYDPESQKIKDQIIKSRQLGTGVDQALGDFHNFFGKMFAGAEEQLKKVISNPGETASAIADDPIGFIGGFGKGLVKPIADMAELSSGVQLTKNDITALTPEEKSERIKGTVAFGAMMAVTGGIGAASKVMGASEEALAGMSTEQLVETSGLTAKGALAKGLLKSSSAGAAGGVAYGAVANANESDQLSSMLIGGIQFGTLGAAHELLFGGGKAENMKVAKHAGELAHLKQVQDVLDNSFKGVVNTTEALSTSDDLAEAILTSRLKTEGNDIIHLPGVSSESIGRLTTHVPEGFSVAHHFNPDGETGDLLVYSNKYTGAKGSRELATQIFKSGEQAVVDDEGNVHSSRYEHDSTIASAEDKGAKFKTYSANHPDRSGWMHQGKFYSLGEVDRLLTGKGGGAVDPKFFAENGYVENQVVGYGGRKQYVVTDGDGKTLQLTNVIDTDEKLSVPRDAVRPLLHMELGNPLDERGLLRFGPLDREAAISRMYQEWKGNIEKPAVPEQPGVEPKTGIDAPQSNDVLKSIPTQDIAAHVQTFLEGKQFAPDEITSLKRDFEKRLAHEAFASELGPDERQMMENSFKAMEQHNLDESKGIVNEREMDSAKLVRLANTNGMTITDGGTGRIVVRDVKSGKIIRGFDTNSEAAQFINKSSQSNGIDLDQGGPISTGSAGGGRGLPPDGPPALPSDFPYNFFNTPRRIARFVSSEHFIRGLDNKELITRNREWFLNIDEKYGTKVHERVMEPTQSQVNIRNTKMEPVIKEVAEIEKGVSKLTSAERERIGQRMQTMSPNEVINKFMSRPMNALEQALGKEISDSNVDIERVFKYNRELEKLNKEFEGVDDKTEYNQHVANAKQAFSIDATHEHVSGLFNQILELGKKDASLGAIIRYARSLTAGPDGGPELSRSQFDAHHKLTMSQIRASDMLESQYQKLGDTFGIHKETRLGGYMTHARLYTDGNISKALRHFSGDVAAREFYAKMARTGEVSAFETDPIRAIQRYVKAGFDAQGFNESMASAKNALEDELAKLPPGARDHTRNVATRYLDDLRGFPAAQDKFIQEAVNEYSDRYNLQTTPDVRKQWVNGALSVIHAATIGARPMMGMFHWATATMISVADRGIAYTKRMHEQGAYARLHPEVMEEIKKVGALSTVSPISSYSSAEYAEQSALGNAVTKGAAAVSKGLFRLTGLPDVFEMVSSGHYLATKADAINAITRFNRDEIPWSQVKKELFLDKHYAPVTKRFGDLVKAGKTEEAAQYLGTQTVNDMVGMFGNANHPYMWGTNTGRIFGQFGNWPLWLRSTVTRMASRGTAAQRIASVAKLGAMSLTGVAAGKELGVDLSRLNVLEGMAWWGGPFEGIAEDVRDAIKGTGYTQQSGQRRVMKLLPFGKDADGQLKLQPSIFVPGSFAIDGLTKAAADFQQGNTGMGLAQTVGLRPNKSFSIRNQ